MTVHPGGSLGVRANETVRAVGDGVVPMAEFAAFQNVGELPLLGIESVPFLIANYEGLQTMHGLVRATWERTLTIAGLWGALFETVRTCSMIGLIIVGALFLSKATARLGLPADVANATQRLSLNASGTWVG